AASREGQVTAGRLRIPLAGLPEGEVVLGIRPEALQLSNGVGTQPILELEVEVVEPLGNETLVHGTVDARGASVDAAEEEVDARANASEGRRAAVTARLGSGERPRPGVRLSFTVDPRSVHAFDPRTGKALRPDPGMAT